jgi:hypothetical protein
MSNAAIDFLRSAADRYNGRAAIIGKGPSFSDFDAERHGNGRFVIGLNEAALRISCDAAFIIDEDILEKSCAELASTSIEALITPRTPHRPSNRIGGLTIYGPGTGKSETPEWKRVIGARWRAFNLETSASDPALGPTIKPGNFSAPILSELLAQAGFKDILLAGVDGGSSYSGTFSDVEYKKLRSVQNDFNGQFKELRGVRDRHQVIFRSARCQEAFILIGTEIEQCLATEVLKWSIESNTFLTVRYCEADSTSRSMYVGGSAGTPFSMQRMFLPEMSGHIGRGIYFDSDMLVFKDVYDLFNTDMGHHTLMGCQPTPGRKTQFSVFLVDNETASWNANELINKYKDGQVSYEWLMQDFAFVENRSSSLPMTWNSLEYFDPGHTANIHFTDMGTQPWLSIYNPNADLWCESLFQAMKERPQVVEALEQSLRNGWVRPSLKWQVEEQRSNPWKMPKHALSLDAKWLPPHVRLRFTASPPRSQLIKWRAASHVRRILQSRNYIRLLRAGQALRKIF